MEIIQKKGSVKHTFRFGEQQINFAYDDKSGSGDVDLNYADIPQKSSIVIERNDWLRNVGLLWCVIGVFQLGLALFSGGSISGKGFWFLLGLICLVWYRLTTVRYTVFTSEAGKLFVIQGSAHDEIIEEISKRRKSQLRSWYGALNPDNELQAEINKFKWLVEQGAISVEESERLIAQATMARHAPESGAPEHRLN